MAMGKHKKPRQEDLWVATADIQKSPGHPFYERLNKILEDVGFDEFVEGRCKKFYAKTMGRPSLAPAVYFRTLLIGYFEGIDSERGIAWRLADSLSLRAFCGYKVSDPTADHSTISRTRRLIDVETHDAVFVWVLKRLAEADLLKGKTVGVDATTLEANAAMRSIVRRDSEESHQDYLKRLAKESGIEEPTREEAAKLDRKRKKKTSNKDWKSPSDPDARIAKMKDGRTHLAHKAEHAVDLESGAIVAVTLQPADRGDPESLGETLNATMDNVGQTAMDEAASKGMADDVLSEIAADKGYHSNETMVDLKAQRIRSYVSEPDRGRRRWIGKEKEQAAVYGNRRRIRGERGKRLGRKRSELVERSFAHCYETGGMRRTHLRGHPNILKRLLIHLAGFNLSLLMRQSLGAGKPRQAANLAEGALSALNGILLWFFSAWVAVKRPARFSPSNAEQPIAVSLAA